MLPEGRTAGDLIREALTDELHKKGYVVQAKLTPGSIELDAEILNFGIKKESGRKAPNQVLAGIAIMGMAVLEGREVHYTTFPIEVLISGPIFEESRYGFVGSKVYLMKGEDYPVFAEKGLADFRDALSWKIPHQETGKGKTAPTGSRRQVKVREAMERRASLLEKEAAELDRFRTGAAEGRAQDQYRLAMILWNGSRHKLMGPDRPASEKWLQAAAEQGHGDAIWALFNRKARPHNESQVSQQDLDEAEKWLRMAALHGNIHAQVFLGSMFCEYNPPVGRSLFSIWTNQRDSPRFSKKFQHDNARAYAWMSIAAAQADSGATTATSRIPAINRLAIQYRDALKQSLPAAEIGRGEALAKELSAQLATPQKAE
jgi:TPR repeat protein